MYIYFFDDADFDFMRDGRYERRAQRAAPPLADMRDDKAAGFHAFYSLLAGRHWVELASHVFLAWAILSGFMSTSSAADALYAARVCCHMPTNADAWLAPCRSPPSAH